MPRAAPWAAPREGNYAGHYGGYVARLEVGQYTHLVWHSQPCPQKWKDAVVLLRRVLRLQFGIGTLPGRLAKSASVSASGTCSLILQLITSTWRSRSSLFLIWPAVVAATRIRDTVSNLHTSRYRK
jgi:hypothetical protein